MFENKIQGNKKVTANTSTKIFSCISNNYQNPWSQNCLKSSIGGCAPYFSKAGIFISSTKTMHFFPIGGPKTPLRLLSSLAMIMFCNANRIPQNTDYIHVHNLLRPKWSVLLTWVWLALVRAEKLMKNGKKISFSKLFINLSLTYTDFPVPVGPTRSSGLHKETKHKDCRNLTL